MAVPMVIISDTPVGIPLTWPHGEYGLPKPQDGCPDTEFIWDTGSRTHDTLPGHLDNEWSSLLHLQGAWDIGSVRHHFCMKTDPGEQNTWAWPSGTYCIYKYGDECPAGIYQLLIEVFSRQGAADLRFWRPS